MPPKLEEWHHLKCKLEQIYLKEKIYWKQRSKQKWLEDGDHNTIYFHVVANHRRKKNMINTLIINGTPTQSLTE